MPVHFLCVLLEDSSCHCPAFEQRPPFGNAPVALGVERTFALLPVEACQVCTGQRYLDDALTSMSIPAAKSPTLGPGVVPRRFIVFRQGCLRRVRSRVEAHNSARKTEHRTPDPILANGDSIERCVEAVSWWDQSLR